MAACYTIIVNKLYVEDGHVTFNVLSRKSCNQILFIDAIISKIETLQTSDRFDIIKTRKQIFKPVKYFSPLQYDTAIGWVRNKVDTPDDVESLSSTTSESESESSSEESSREEVLKSS